MAAPAGLTGGSVPEPAALEPPDPGAAGEAGAESALAVADPEPDEAVPVTDPVSVAQPGPAEPVSVPDPGPAEAVSAAVAAPGPTEPVAGAGPTRRTSLLAVAAVILGLIALAGVAVAILAVATHGFRAKSVVQYRVAAVFSLRPGDCLNSLPNGADVTLLSCSAPHDAEVFATFSLAASTWPGAAAVQSQAGNGCQSRIAGYLNPQLANAGLAQEYYYPDQAAWGAGVRTVVCEVSASTGQLTGSVRAPG